MAPTRVLQLLTLATLGIGVTIALLRVGPKGDEPGDVHPERARLTEPPLWPAPPFELTDSSGAEVTPSSLKGKPWVANFIFTQCTTICPLLTAKMVQLQRKLTGVEVRFVSFSVDPEHDTPGVLADYAHHWNPEEKRWTLLANSPQSLAAIAAGFHITAQKNPTAGTADPILHSSSFVLVDATGAVRGIYNSEDREAFTALAQDVRTLAHAAGGAEPALEASGEALYRQLSCINCHDRPALAPSLHALKKNGRADPAYVRESILQPEAQRVAGYPLHMPSYDGVIDPHSLDTLVAWVLSLPDEAPVEAGRVEIDPVCQMEVRVTDGETPTAEREGKAFYFCSDRCRTRFLTEPH